MYIYIYICIYLYIYICVFVCIDIHMYMCIHVYTYVERQRFFSLILSHSHTFVFNVVLSIT